MPNLSTVENNFTKGLVTEFTGLNFPENAATDADNCEFTLVGDVLRREGFNTELNGVTNTVNRINSAINTYKWNNVGGDGLTQMVVEQVGSNIYFYKSSAATIVNPLSTQRLTSIISLSSFAVSGSSLDATIECQFASGNGYLFVYHPNCDPFFCSFNAGVITASAITMKIRDLNGVNEANVAVNTRPASLSNDHLYNLTNQGWTQGNAWSATVTSGGQPLQLGNVTLPIQAGLAVSLGDFVNVILQSPVQPGGLPAIPVGTILMSGSVVSYSGSNLTINVISFLSPSSGLTGVFGNPTVVPINHGYINSWLAAEGNFPSNADVWWYFKDGSGAFNPALMQPSTNLNTGPAPKGHYILNAFSQTRSLVSGISGLTDVITTVRPRTGTWFQGRVWYAGVDAQQVATGDAAFYTWTENIYFSQITLDNTNFGSCYQTNDQTSENLFDLLPTDGGIIKIQDCGSIYKLFPIQNGLLVFASNGIWFITGSQGIGFSANDYTANKISSVQCISSTSFVDVNGLPYFWNEEGIYAVQPSKNGGLEVDPITVGTILQFYNQIPKSSKKYARGAYHPIDYVIQWVYKDTEATSVTDRYSFNKILNFNNYNKAFYPYSIDITNLALPTINGVTYVNNPGGIGAPDPGFKYNISTFVGGTYNLSFADEGDGTFVDWATTNYDSFFTTGFKLHGQGQRRFQIPYIYIFSRTDEPIAYKIQGLWDYAKVGDSGRWSSAQIVNINNPSFGMAFRRHKLRGRGLVLQIKLKSVDGQPFDIMGWSTFETQNAGV